MDNNEANNIQDEELDVIKELVEMIRNEMDKMIIGQEEMTNLMLTSLFCGGHILLEGVPGIAKTLAAKVLSKTLAVDFSRIQFTPDLMPTDIIGTSVFNLKMSEFTFKKGPVFSNVVLIDEINRCPAKTQAALFEVMEEKQISVDGITYKMEYPFLVIATQNPIEQEGTYKLPEAQLDRFLFRIKMNYPSIEEEKLILQRYKEDFDTRSINDVKPVLTAKEIRHCRQIVERIHIKDDLIGYIAEIVHKSRNTGDLFLGASPRASLSILKSSKAMAAIHGRNFVTPDDIRAVSTAVLNHRLILSSERELEGVTVEQVIDDIIKKIDVPR